MNNLNKEVANNNSGAGIIVGQWEYYDSSSGSTSKDFVYTFNADGTGNDIKITYDETGGTFELEYDINGDILNIEDSLGEDTLYKRVK